MAVIMKKGETIDSELRRFKKEMVKSGVLMDLHKLEYYVAPSRKRRLKEDTARKRAKKNSK